MVEANITVDSETLDILMMTSDDSINLWMNYSNGTET